LIGSGLFLWVSTSGTVVIAWAAPRKPKRVIVLEKQLAEQMEKEPEFSWRKLKECHDMDERVITRCLRISAVGFGHSRLYYTRLLGSHSAAFSFSPFGSGI
jgi:hypothetical protein